MPQLGNIRHERFARLIAQGKNKSIAYRRAGYTVNNGNATRLWRHMGKASESIQRRVQELIMEAKDLTQDDILNRVLMTYELASNSGQHSAALKACEMLGKQMFKMFGERRENVNINLGNMDKQTLYKFLQERYGNRAQELITWLNNHYSNELNNSVDDMQNPGRNENMRPVPQLQLITNSDWDDDSQHTD